MRLPTGRALTHRRPSQKQADRCGGPTEARAAGLQGSLHREAFAEPSHVTHPLASRIKGSAPQPPRAASLGGGPKGRRSLGKPAHLLGTDTGGGRKGREEAAHRRQDRTSDCAEVPRPVGCSSARLRTHPTSSPGGTPRHRPGNPKTSVP